MDMDRESLRHKKIAIAGFGTEGRAVLKFLHRYGIIATVLDTNSSLDLESDIPRCTGEQYLDRLQDFDVVFRSPGIPLENPRFRQAIKRGVTVSSPTEFFFQQAPCPIIGVTGTKGKGTTALLIEAILTQAGKHVFLGGNIGLPPLEFLDRLAASDTVVLELSSFQLQGLTTSPHIAVITNITSDHLDYHADRSEYYKAKTTIVRYQRAEDITILNGDDEGSKGLALLTPARKFWFSTEKLTEPGAYCFENQLYLRIGGEEKFICRAGELRLPGRHNISNTLAAMLAARAVGVEDEPIRTAVKQFTGQPHHRLERIAVVEGVAYFNDSAATVPDATIAALDAFPQPKVLIAGGSDKGVPYHELVERIMKGDVRGVATLGPTGRVIADLLQRRGYPGKLVLCESMEQAVATAAAWTKRGDIVLLSPASASFGMFKNYQERGEAFRKAVQGLDAP